MFAPYCSTCESRVLLSTRRIVRFSAEEPAGAGLIDVVLRCYCGTEVAADANPPQPVVNPAPPHPTPGHAVSDPRSPLPATAAAAC
ncbi:hypothetical protein [Sporichthya polymorpha]|uniref:hypothetical protein n=1 Tax=Sporichthya polymorpha TaxID=35751 RepID=UPI00037BD202|nr:hypothetical protein [Sporichthya polymorpha]